MRIEEIALISKFRNRIGDRVVKAKVKRSEFFHFDRRAPFHDETSYFLAKIAIVANNLLNGKSSRHQLAPMPRRRYAHFTAGLPLARPIGAGGGAFGLRPQPHAEPIDQLIEENRHPVFRVLGELLGQMPLDDPGSAAVDQISPVCLKEIMQHFRAVRPTAAKQ